MTDQENHSQNLSNTSAVCVNCMTPLSSPNTIVCLSCACDQLTGTVLCDHATLVQTKNNAQLLKGATASHSVQSPNAEGEIGGSPLGALGLTATYAAILWLCATLFQKASSEQMFGTAYLVAATVLSFLLVQFVPRLKTRLKCFSGTNLFARHRRAVVAVTLFLVPSIALCMSILPLDDLLRDIRPIKIGPEKIVPLILYMLLGAPIIEEILFRGVILRGLIRRGWQAVPAILISTVLFSVVHLNPPQIIAAAAVGIFLGALYVGGRSIWLCVFAHMLYNACVILLGPKIVDSLRSNAYDFPESGDGMLVYTFGGALGIIGLGCWGLYRLSQRDRGISFSTFFCSGFFILCILFSIPPLFDTVESKEVSESLFHILVALVGATGLVILLMRRNWGYLGVRICVASLGGIFILSSVFDFIGILTEGGSYDDELGKCLGGIFVFSLFFTALFSLAGRTKRFFCPNAPEFLHAGGKQPRFTREEKIQLGKRPVSVTIIGWFLAFTGVAALISLFVLIQNPEATLSMGDSTIPVPVQFGVTFLTSVVVTGCGFAILRQQNWARYLFLGYGVFNVLFQLITATNKIQVIPAGVMLFIVAWFLLTRRANAYFKGRETEATSN